MAREDEILKAFMRHPLLKEEYGISETDLPKTIIEGMHSTFPIIQAITLIVKGSQSKNVVTDADIQRQVFQILNQRAV